MLWWALFWVAWAEPEVTEHTEVYYNARLALREGRALDAAKFWLLRNALEDHTGRVSPHDADFHSVTWAALGDLGICQDGHPTDEAGAGIWPVAFHNWVVRNRTRRPRTDRPRSFETFEVGRQQRFISIGDVLDLDELKSVRLHRWGCLRPRFALLAAGESIAGDLSDRQVSTRLMRHLLEQGRATLDTERVRGTAAIEARLFDIDLKLTELAAREARRKERERARRGRTLGLSRESVSAMREEAPESTLSPDSDAARILDASVDWPAEEWMAISPERRLFLFDHAASWTGRLDALDGVALGVIDRLIEEGQGVEVSRWIAHQSEASDPEAIWGGERGKRLMALGDEAGFGERAVIALHRGVHHLERGDLPSSMTSLAYALRHAPDSRASEEVHSLSLRWLSYVASQFEITDALLLTLMELVPRREYGLLLEDLMWGAAFRADQTSFERGVRHQVGRGALGRRIELLEPLAQGRIGGFATRVRTGLRESPNETLRFLSQLVQRLELEDADVRAAHRPTLVHLRDLLEPLASSGDGGRQGKAAGAVLDRVLAIGDGLGGLGVAASQRERARALDPDREVYAGSVRLAPSDPLPWPFYASEIAAPSVFTPMSLRPVEWRDAQGEWVFGWSISG